MEKQELLEAREKELGKIALYNKLYAEKTIDAKKDELKAKMSKAMEANDFASMTAIAKEISNLAKENERKGEIEKLLSIREIKRTLSSIVSLIPDSGIDVIVYCPESDRGIRFKTKAESKSVKIDSGVTLEKNKTVTKVSAVESFTAKVARLSGLHPDIHVTHSDLSYPKTAKAWLTKNFPEELAIS